jgi:hypothetical protein
MSGVEGLKVPDLEERARELLATEYERGGCDGPYPSYAELARTGTGAFTMCSIRAVQAALSAIEGGGFATPPATPIAGDVLWLDRWADLERLAKAASAVVGQPDEEDWFMPQHFANLEPEDAAFIAATNPAAILELIAAARRDEEAGQ